LYGLVIHSIDELQKRRTARQTSLDLSVNPVPEISYTESATILFALNSADYACARLAAKHSPHSTGRPLEGLKGTESVLPHWSQVISKRWRSPPAPLPPPPKFARRASRQALQRFGWLRFLSV
jgi:hypothetical protein